MTLLSLAIISFFALLGGEVERGFVRILVLILASLSTHFIIANIFKATRLAFTESALPVFVFFLITDPRNSIFLIIFGVILSLIFSNFLRFGSKEAVNSTALSLVIMSTLGLQITWWGTNTNLVVVGLILALGIAGVSVSKNTLPTTVFFVTTFLVNVLFTLNLGFSFKQLLVPGFIFFSFFLLPAEFMLGSHLKKWVYPALAALIAITLPKLGFFTDPLLSSLVITDLVFAALGNAKISGSI